MQDSQFELGGKKFRSRLIVGTGKYRDFAETKAAVSDKLIAIGGTITHHHAVGRYHRPWYDRQRPDGFALALKAAKKALDPRVILNPGVLIDPD